MFQLILMMTLFPQQPQAIARVQQTETVAQVQPCVWPRTCSQTQAAPSAAVPAVVAEALAPITTCQWPNVCSQESEGPIRTCDYPNKCS